MIKLIRFAEEGFVNKPQTHTHTIGEVLEGCFAFIEQEEMALLSFKEEYLAYFPELKGRENQTRHELLVHEDSMVYVKNIHIVGSKEDIIMTEDAVFIPQEPIIKSIERNGYEFPLHPQMYVKVTLAYAKERLEKLKECNSFIRSHYHTDEIYANTQYANYCEVIVNTNWLTTC